MSLQWPGRFSLASAWFPDGGTGILAGTVFPVTVAVVALAYAARRRAGTRRAAGMNAT